MSIELIEISKTYTDGAIVLDRLTLEVQRGELFVLLGASGSGKSSLLRIIAGLSTPDSGRVLIHDTDVTNLPPQQRNVGVVFQSYSLFQHMSIADNVGFALDVNHTPRGERNRRVGELLELIGLGSFAKRMPRQLSGGQQQRVALARALAHEPGVLLLDEPFGALDAKIRAQLRQSLREIQQRLNVTAILVTHDQDEAFELADRIGVIDHGQLLEVGTPRELYQQPRHRFTASFLGITNLLQSERAEGGLLIGQAALIPAAGTTTGTPTILLRPENVALAQTTESLNGQLIGRGQVESVTFMGAFQQIAVQLEPRAGQPPMIIRALLTAEQTAGWSLRLGEALYVGMRAYNILPA